MTQMADFSEPFLPKNLKENFTLLREHLPEMLQKQEALQIDIMGEDWRQEFDTGTRFSLPKIAILAEVGELIHSLSFKWWTKQEANPENALLELVDIHHFVLIDILLMPEVQEFSRSIPDIPESLLHIKRNLWHEILGLVESTCIRPKTREVLRSYLIRLSVLIEALGYEAEDFLKLYEAKNSLNKERQEKGYKENPDVKFEDGKEDNERLFEEVPEFLRKMKEAQDEENN